MGTFELVRKDGRECILDAFLFGGNGRAFTALLGRKWYVVTLTWVSGFSLSDVSFIFLWQMTVFSGGGGGGGSQCGGCGEKKKRGGVYPVTVFTRAHRKVWLLFQKGQTKGSLQVKTCIKRRLWQGLDRWRQKAKLKKCFIWFTNRVGDDIGKKSRLGLGGGSVKIKQIMVIWWDCDFESRVDLQRLNLSWTCFASKIVFCN